MLLALLGFALVVPVVVFLVVRRRVAGPVVAPAARVRTGHAYRTPGRRQPSRGF